jgi:quercetin dioxygenase-like cupin family protein
MKRLYGIKKSLIAGILAASCVNGLSFASNAQSHAEVSSQVFDKVKQNDNWKLAFLTAKDAQIVFMNISPDTNPNNEIGVETHKFDQIIFVVEGNGKAILDGKTTMVKSGDMIFIPQGIEHNVINSNAKKPLKILSVYSSTDIPVNSAFKKKSDVPQD